MHLKVSFPWKLGSYHLFAEFQANNISVHEIGLSFYQEFSSRLEELCLRTMTTEEQKALIEYNKMRESRCWLEGKTESTWLRPQRRHYPQFNRSSIDNYREEKHEIDTGRTSWVAITPPQHKERRHFPEKSKLILLPVLHCKSILSYIDYMVFRETSPVRLISWTSVIR